MVRPPAYLEHTARPSSLWPPGWTVSSLLLTSFSSLPPGAVKICLPYHSVADPGYGAFLTPGSGMVRKSASGSGIRDEQPGSYFVELRNHFFGLKYLNSLMRIRDPRWRQFGSGMEKSRIRDKHPGSATLPYQLIVDVARIVSWTCGSHELFRKKAIAN
jgi:hypothetical protein